MTESYHLAQLNIAKMRFPFESDQMLGFVDKLDEINSLADHSPGFIWRLETTNDNATSINVFGSDILVNLSVWQSRQSLYDYVYKSAHKLVMKQRKQWFYHLDQPYTVLWWIPKGEIPSCEQAKQKLELLKKQGPTKAAFIFKTAFQSPDDVIR